MSRPSPGTEGGGKRDVTGKANCITTFFKPVTPPQQSLLSNSNASQQALDSSNATPPPPSPPISSSPPDLPSTPPEYFRTEISGSDDEGSDGDSSDESLEDLSCLLGHSKKEIPAPWETARQHDPFSTPQAKRTAVEFHSSPLAIMPRHKFDLKALAKDARCDDAITASSLKVKQAAKEKGATTFDGSAFGDTIAGIVKGKGGQDQVAQKVLRAVQRSEQSHVQLRYLFFDESYKIPSLPRAPSLPKGSPWNLLTQGSVWTREQHLISGVPQTILRKKSGLPDSLFEWMLDSLCLHPSFVVRQEYGNMIASCPEQIGRLLTAERIKQLFILLGAKYMDHSNPGLCLSKIDHKPYSDRDWPCLLSFISLLGMIAGQLSIGAVKYATRILVQLALDKFLICDAEMLFIYEYAMQELTTAIPSPSWDTSCFEISSFLSGIKSRSIKTTALLCLPISAKRTHDLRRRIAVSTLFEDVALALHNVEDMFTIRGIIDCLNGESFAIKPTTDFAELRASIILLDMVVDDGSVIQFDDRGDESKFNEEVDELAGKLREIWRKTNDAGMRLARTEAKSVMEWVQQRLLQSVRTRKKARKSIFDIPGQQEDPFLPRQRKYMQKFLQKKKSQSPDAMAEKAQDLNEVSKDEEDKAAGAHDTTTSFL